LKAREIKCLPHVYLPKHDYSIWHDGSHQLQSLPSTFPEIGAYLHTHGLSVEQMVDFLIEEKVFYRFRLEDQLKNYQKEQFDITTLAFQTGVLIRKNNEKFNDYWWNEIKKFGNRDQISFSYSLFKLNLECEALSPGNVFENPYFSYTPHAKTKIPIKFI
jgi:hypothetical protein